MNPTTNVNVLEKKVISLDHFSVHETIYFLYDHTDHEKVNIKVANTT